jgi:hypothetical protein
MEPDKIKNISLSYACERNWNDMKEVAGGRFCDGCQHVVHDFTTQSDCHLKKMLSENTRVCGRFKRSQMSAGFLKYAAATVIAVSTVAVNSCQEEINPAFTIDDSTTESKKLEGAATEVLDTTATEFYTLGIVVSNIESEEETSERNDDEALTDE